MDHERIVLGSMMLNATVIDDATEVLTGADFADQRHEVIFDAIVHLASSGKPTDSLAVADRLRSLGVKFDAAYLHECVQSVSVTQSCGYYAEQVKAAATIRRVVATGHALIELGTHADPDPLDILNTARARLDALIVDDADDTHESSVYAAIQSLDEPLGVPTPWESLDRIVAGWGPGMLYIVGARPGVGKALALDTPLPTPTGWTTMGEVRVGDYVIGMDGRPCRVSFATEVQHDRKCFEVTFDDGSKIIADAEHLWLTETRSARRAATPPKGYVYKRSSPYSRDQRSKSEKSSVKTTVEIRSTLRVGSDGRLNHAVPTTEPIETPAADLPVDPWLLGYWLGDGTSRCGELTVSDDDVAYVRGRVLASGSTLHDAKSWQRRPGANCATYGVDSYPADRSGGRCTRDPRSLAARLSLAGVLGNKHIPAAYLRASTEQRLALMRGLIDSDGTVGRGGRVSFDVTSERLADGFYELAVSLGIKAFRSSRMVKGRNGAQVTCHRIGFTTPLAVAGLPRKAMRLPTSTRSTTTKRMIVSVEPVPSVPVRCIQVDNSDHMYLAGRSMIPTHNTVFGIGVLLDMARRGKTAVMVSLEMPKSELYLRMLSTAGVPGDRIMHRRLDKEDHARMAKAAAAISLLPIVVDDRSALSLAQIRAKVKGVQRTRDVGVVVVDYLGLVKPPGDVPRNDRRVQVDAIAQGLKELARDLRVPVVALAQLNRGIEGRAVKVPTLADLRESGGIEAAADVAILLHRDHEESPEELQVSIPKNRHGPQGQFRLAFRGQFSRIDDHHRAWQDTA